MAFRDRGIFRRAPTLIDRWRVARFDEFASRERIRNHFTLDKMGSRMAQLFECAATNSPFDPENAPKDLGVTQEVPGRLTGFVTTAALLLSPKNVGLKLKNLSLLFRILLHSQKRLRLADTFDSRYYLAHQPDLQARGVAPLLHYALQGYLEGRLPSPHFDATGEPGIEVNPVLWRIYQHD